MRVRDVMSSPVVCAPPSMRLKEVADLLVRHRISAVPVVHDGELVGLVSEADQLPLEQAPDPRAHLSPLPEPPAGVPRVVAEVMTRDVVALPEEADSADAARLMLERRIKSIPIVRGAQVVGIVARRDLLEVLSRNDEAIARDLEGRCCIAPGQGGEGAISTWVQIAMASSSNATANRRLAAPQRPARNGPVERSGRRHGRQ